MGEIPRTPGPEKAGGTAEQGYLHCGPSGAGHFVKMVHNGIEYVDDIRRAKELAAKQIHYVDVGSRDRLRRLETACHPAYRAAERDCGSPTHVFPWASLSRTSKAAFTVCAGLVVKSNGIPNLVARVVSFFSQPPMPRSFFDQSGTW